MLGGGGEGGGGSEGFRYLYGIPTLALSFDSGKNIYLFSPRGDLYLIHESLRAANKS